MIRRDLRIDDAYYHLAGIMERKKDFHQSLEYYKRVWGLWVYALPDADRIAHRNLGRV